jgi:hypothetical protein
MPAQLVHERPMEVVRVADAAPLLVTEATVLADSPLLRVCSLSLTLFMSPV